MKFIIEAKNLTELNRFRNNQAITDVIVGVEGLSHGLICKLSIDQINTFLQKENRPELSLRITRLFHEDELVYLENKLRLLNLNKIKFIFYTDLVIYQLLTKWQFSSKLVYDGYTYTTNTSDVNAYQEFNQYVTISNQISFDELTKITTKMTKPNIIYAFGKAIILYSKRKLLTNYFLYRNQKNDPHLPTYYLQEEFRQDLYHIYEDEFGTYIYQSDFYYLFLELNKLTNVDYALIEGVDLKTSLYEKVIEAYLNNDYEAFSKIPLKASQNILKNKSILLKEDFEEVNNND